jgi:hypothetical protein
MNLDANNPADYASPARFAHELELGAGGYEPVGRQQARDVARWHTAEHARLIAARLATSPEELRRTADAVAATLDHVMDPSPGMTVSLYWPFRGELDLRGWRARSSGGPASLCRWSWPRRAPWSFASGAPAVGWSAASGTSRRPPMTRPSRPTLCWHRWWDSTRTATGSATAAASSTAPSRPCRLKARAIGVGRSTAAIPTIYPQPHDVRMDAIVTGTGVVPLRSGVG